MSFNKSIAKGVNSGSKTELVCEISNQKFIIPKRVVGWYEELGVMLPRLSPEERYRRLLSYRNERKFFWRKCDKTGARIYSTYPESAPFPVCSFEYWLEDPRDGTHYGRDYDPQVPFLTQLLWLWKEVTRPASTVRNLVAALVDHPVAGEKNSFFVFGGQRLEDCHYCVDIRDSKHCIDCSRVSDCAQCYECVDCVNCISVRWGEHCRGCEESWFVSNCFDCRRCLFCSNLSGAENYVRNEPVSPERFDEIFREQQLSWRANVEQAIEEFAIFLRDQPVPHLYADDVESCCGNYLRNCNDVVDSFECNDSSQLAYCYGLNDAHLCLDGYGFGESLRESANFVSAGMRARRLFDCVECHTNVSDLRYCFHCENSTNLFGCVGIRGAQYCILNKQYSQSDYQRAVSDIIAVMEARGEWGKMLPASLSEFPYNHSSASDYLPLSKVQATMFGYRWDDEGDGIRPSQLLYGDAPGDRFAEIPPVVSSETLASLSEGIFICEMSGAPFKFTLAELNLYQKWGVAPPARSFEQRNSERMRKLSSRKMFERVSDKSGKAISSAFPANWRRPVFECKEWEKVVAENSKGLKR